MSAGRQSGTRFREPLVQRGVRTADKVTLDQHGVEIRVVSPPYFLGTKLEAFKGRGHGDFAMSHDLEDIVSVIDGRASIVDEIKAAHPGLREYVASEFSALIENEEFIAALPGFLLPDPASQRRLPILLERLKSLASIGVYFPHKCAAIRTRTLAGNDRLPEVRTAFPKSAIGA